jgi:dTDP-4-amino-4,6-dideoxygalactose transaminase
MQFSDSSDSAVPSVLDAGAVRYVNRGCMAIGLALQHAQVGNGDEVLLPAYHCISMIEPVIWRGARPMFYRINADTSVNLEDVAARITNKTKVLLVTHYFGFPQDMARIRAFCDTHRLLLIEDCAHAFFGTHGGLPIGSFGDYAVASAWKFFPIIDGGLIVSARKDLADIELHAPGLWGQAKAMVNTVEQSFEYRRLPVARLLLKAPLMLKDMALRQVKRGAPIAPPTADEPTTGLGGWGFDSALVHRKMSFSSRLITALASKRRICEKRRRNYRTLLAELGNLQGCRPLFPSLPDGVVPQVFPLVFDTPEMAFRRLKLAGVPIIRFGEYLWDGMDALTCPVSKDLSRRVFQLPCHQELLDSELNWMIDQIRLESTR